MFKKVLVGLAFLIGAIAIVIALQPSDFRISRSATISAPPEKVFAQVNDLHNWEEWSPWAKLDPKATNTYEGPPAGKGASLVWSGNNEVGEGRMTITESRPYELIQFELEFVRPFVATNTTEFTFRPEGNGTQVTWSMFGENNFIGKAMSLIMNCEKMVGPQFEQGLRQMKVIAEAPSGN